MKVNAINKISSKQAAGLIVSAQICISLTLLPSSIMKIAGHDAWISCLIGGIFVLIACFLIILLCNRFNGSSILEINNILFGKYIAFVLNLIVLLNILLITIAQLTIFIHGISIWFFKSTPYWILTLYVCIPSIYITNKGLKTICRFNFIIYLFVPLVLSLIILNINHFRVTQILPLLQHSPLDIISAVPITAQAYAGFELLMFIYPYIQQRKKIKKHISIAIIISTLIFTITVITSVGVFGEILLGKKFNAIMGLARMIRVPVFERVDLYYLAIWISGMVLTINIYYFLVFNITTQVFKLKSKVVTLLIISIIIVTLIVLVKDSGTSLRLLVFSGYSAILVGIVSPTLLIIISLIFKKKKADKK